MIDQRQQINFNLKGGYNPVRSAALNNQTAFNCFVFDDGIFSTPGHKKLYAIADTGNARGIFYSQLLKQVIIVVDDGVYRCTDSDYHRIFNLSTLTGSVYISENSNNTDPSTGNAGGQVVISDGDAIYVYTLDGKMSKAKSKTGTNLPFSPGMITFQDDYFFAIDFKNNRVYASELNNGLAWDADSYATIESIATGLIAFERMLIVFGKNIALIFHDAALSPFPYTKDITRSWQFGCQNPDSIAVGNGIMCWLGSNEQSGPVILASNGSEPQAISTEGIDHIIDNLTKPNDCHGFLYQMDGHLFYQINFNTDNMSLLYDFNTKLWYRVSDYRYQLHPIKKVAYYSENNKLIAISNKDGLVYDFSSEIYNENGNIVPRLIISENLTNEENPMELSQLDIRFEQGVNRNPAKIALSVSKDSGQTFKQVQTKELGITGNRQNLVRFRNLGMGRWWTIKLEFFSLDRMVILDNAKGYFI